MHTGIRVGRMSAFALTFGFGADDAYAQDAFSSMESPEEVHARVLALEKPAPPSPPPYEPPAARSGSQGQLVITNDLTTNSPRRRRAQAAPHTSRGRPSSISTTRSFETSRAFVAVGVNGYLLLHVAPHLFAGFDPNVSQDLTHSFDFPSGDSEQVRATTFGAGFIVGGSL